MRYKIEETKDETIVYVFDDVTFKDHELFFEIIDKIKSDKNRKYVLDFSGSDFIDSAGLGLLVITHDEACFRNIDIIIRNPSERVDDIICASRFDSLYKIERNV